MEPGINMDPELLALVKLARELATHKVQVGMRDALPALVIGTAVPGVCFYVFVSCSGEEFTWLNADNRHPVSDLVGAAAQIAVDARSWDSVTAMGGVR